MYDIIVIGAGSGGLNVAVFMRKAGFKVLLIDKSDRSIGGDCLNTGCVPSKALIHTARLAKSAQESTKFGLKVDGAIDLKKVANYVDSKREVIRKHENAAHFRKQGIDVALGFAIFTGKNEVQVAGKKYRGKKIVIATGSSPRKLDVPGIEKVNVHTNESIFDVATLPQKMLVIGGGPIGIELGQAFSHLGSHVTVVEKGSQFLPKEDEKIAEVLKGQLERDGIKVMLNTDIVEFPSKNKVEIKHAGKKQTLEFDLVLVSIGRDLNTKGLDLEKAGVELLGNGNIKVDEYLRTTNKNILTCGDVAGGFQFTHAAEVHAGVILNNFFSPFKKKVSYDNFSWVTYTSPEIATFGLREVDLKKRKQKYEVLEMNFKDDDRSIVTETTNGKMKLFVNKGKLLGGTMIAKNAGEIFQELVLANSAGLDIKHLFNKTYPYPTASRVNKRIIQLKFAGKLTPFVKKVMKWMYH